MNEEVNYKMRRNVLSVLSFAEADDHVSYWLNKTPTERLNAACFIINNLFSVSADTRIKKDILIPRKHNNG